MPNDEPLAGGDYVFRDTDLSALPSFLRRWLHDLTYNEAHAMELGMLGVFAAIAVHLGFVSLAVYGSGFLLAVTFGIEERYLKAILGRRGSRVCERCKRSAIGRRLLRIEPWYFALPYLASGIGTYLVIEFILGGFA